MIYEHLDTTERIRQGDIFIGLPRLDLSLNQVVVCTEQDEYVTSWSEIAKKGEPVDILTSVRPVAAIVVTQDCDASRNRDITLCEINDFRFIEGKCKDTQKPDKWKNIITQHARLNLKWFYLPPDDMFGSSEKMAVDFTVTMRLPREDLENLRELRKGRLNKIAYEHFRERLGEFYRRYPYDEWYPLNAEELQCYMKQYPGTEAFAWQKKFIEDDGSKDN
jgi:hypothetical protein